MFNLPYLPIPDAPRTIYGNSGCIVRTCPDNTTKISNSAQTGVRLFAQGLYLGNNSPGRSILPQVFKATEASVVMETLNPIDWQNTDPVVVMRELEQKLSQQVWNHPAMVEVDWHDRLYNYVDEKLEMLENDTSSDPLSPVTAKNVRRLIIQLETFETHGENPVLETRMIHGDPTLDNCMLRVSKKPPETVELVVIDPLPVTSNGPIPSFVQVDIGKMLQSAFGYEWVLNTKDLWKDTVKYDMDELIMAACDAQTDLQMKAALIFCVIHYVRLLPYQFKKRQLFIKLLEEVIDYVEHFGV